MSSRLTVALAAVAGLTAASGCDSPTTMLVEVSLRPGTPAPSSLSASIFDLHGRIAHVEDLLASPLPGHLVVRGLPAIDQSLRIAVSDGARASRGAAEVAVHARQQTRVSLELAADVLDSDGDGVPDSIDHCDTEPDPNQTDGNGDGVSDACDPNVAVDLRLTDLPLSDSDGATDLKGDLGPPTDCPGPYLFCDGFESGTINGTAWGTGETPGSGHVEVDTSRAHRGRYSVKFGIDSPSDADVYVESQIAESGSFPNDPTYIRMWLYVPTSFPSLIETSLIKVRQQADPYGAWVLGLTNRNFASGSYYFGGPTDKISTTRVPLDRWACIEVLLDNGTPDMGVGGSAKVWLDGVELTDLGASSLYVNPPFGRIYIGQDTTIGPGTGPFAYWVDEIAVDNKPIGCGN